MRDSLKTLGRIKKFELDEQQRLLVVELEREEALSKELANLIETYEKETRSLTMVFLPPVAMRLFDVNTLAPYCISTNAVLTSKIHTLYETLLALYKEDKNNVTIIMDPWVPNKGIEQ